MHIHAERDDIGVSKYISENKFWEIVILQGSEV